METKTLFERMHPGMQQKLLAETKYPNLQTSIIKTLKKESFYVNLTIAQAHDLFALLDMSPDLYELGELFVGDSQA